MFSNVLLKISTCWCTFFHKNKLDQLQLLIERSIKSDSALLQYTFPEFNTIYVIFHVFEETWK